MGQPEQDGSAPYDFGSAWEHPHAYALIKSAIYKLFMLKDDFNPENPYDSLIARITTVGMIHSAHELDKKIEVRYDWEMLDDDNVIMHSCYGFVDKIDVRINAEEMGFILDLGDDEYGVFAYDKIFWVCESND